MRLKWKLGIGFSAVIVVAMIVNVIVVSSIFLPEFQRLDERAAERNGARAHEFLQTEINSLKSVTRDWAQWDDTYKFASDLNKDYLSNNLKPEDFETLDVDAYVLLDENGTVRLRQTKSPNEANLFEVGRPLPSGMFARVPMKDHAATSEEGVVATPLGPMLVSVGPITTSQYDGPQRGYLMFARLLEPRLDQHIRTKSHLDFDLTPVTAAKADGGAADQLRRTADDTPSDGVLMETYTLRDLSGEPSYLLQVATPKEFAGIGRIAIGGAIIRFLGFGLVFWAIVTWAVGRIIVKPLTEMVEKMSHIASTGDLDKQLDTARNDEIGWVADVFNRMIRELKSARSRQMEKSYSTGMADLSAGILNNVRSALKPVIDANRSARDMADRFDTAKVAEAGREMTHSTIDQEQRQKLGSYLAAYSEGTRIRLADLKHQLNRIDESAQHIQNILEDHESISKWPSQSTPVDCKRLVEETARGVTSADDTPIDLEISHVTSELPPVIGHGFVFRQVIGNLLSNSVDSIHRAQRKRGRIHIITRLAELGGVPMVEVVVGDNGAGFTGMQAERLFERGYSIRSDRPGGFGLHWCRTTLAAMNASIVGQSPGPGLGATFRVFLPVAPQAVVAGIDDTRSAQHVA